MRRAGECRYGCRASSQPFEWRQKVGQAGRDGGVVWHASMRLLGAVQLILLEVPDMQPSCSIRGKYRCDRPGEAKLDSRQGPPSITKRVCHLPLPCFGAQISQPFLHTRSCQLYSLFPAGLRPDLLSSLINRIPPLSQVHSFASAFLYLVVILLVRTLALISPLIAYFLAAIGALSTVEITRTKTDIEIPPPGILHWN